MPRISEKRQLENEIASTIEVVALAMLLDSDSESEEVEEDYDDLISTLALAYHAISDSRYLHRAATIDNTINGPLTVLLPETKARLLLHHLCILPCLLHICIFILHFFCCDMLIVGEYILLHFVNPICWLASQTLVVFLHPRDQIFEFFGLPRSHRVGG